MKVEVIQEIEDKFENACREMTRQSGYIEGSLETLTSLLINSDPDLAMSADRLIKAFHSIEGICTSGYEKAFEDLKSCMFIVMAENEKLSRELEEYTKASLKEALIATSKKKGKNNE